MATILDICTGALRKLGVLHGNESASSEDASYCLEELNDMMTEMEGQQIYINWPAGVVTGDTFSLDDHHVSGVKAMLAVRVSPAFGGDGLVSGELRKQANDGYSRLFGDYHRPDELAVDDGLAQSPNFWRYGVDNINV